MTPNVDKLENGGKCIGLVGVLTSLKGVLKIVSYLYRGSDLRAEGVSGAETRLSRAGQDRIKVGAIPKGGLPC